MEIVAVGISYRLYRVILCSFFFFSLSHPKPSFDRGLTSDRVPG